MIVLQVGKPVVNHLDLLFLYLFLLLFRLDETSGLVLQRVLVLVDMVLLGTLVVRLLAETSLFIFALLLKILACRFRSEALILSVISESITRSAIASSVAAVIAVTALTVAVTAAITLTAFHTRTTLSVKSASLRSAIAHTSSVTILSALTVTLSVATLTIVTIAVSVVTVVTALATLVLSTVVTIILTVTALTVIAVVTVTVLRSVCRSGLCHILCRLCCLRRCRRGRRRMALVSSLWFRRNRTLNLLLGVLGAEYGCQLLLSRLTL